MSVSANEPVAAENSAADNWEHRRVPFNFTQADHVASRPKAPQLNSKQKEAYLKQIAAEEKTMLEKQPADYVDRFQAIKAAAPCENQTRDKLQDLNREFEYVEDLYRQKLVGSLNARLLNEPKYTSIVQRLVHFNKKYDSDLESVMKQ